MSNIIPFHWRELRLKEHDECIKKGYPHYGQGTVTAVGDNDDFAVWFEGIGAIEWCTKDEIIPTKILQPIKEWQ